MPLDAKDRDELKGMISSAKKRQLNFGICLGKKPEELAILTHKTQTPSALAREAKARVGATKTVTGTLQFLDGALRLTCPEGAPAGMARRLSTYFKTAKLSLKVVLTDAEGGTLEADGATEGLEEDLDEREDEDDGSWARLKAQLEPRVALALKMDGEEATRIRASWGLANETADEGDYTRAAQIAERLIPMLDKLTPQTGKTEGPEAEWAIAKGRIEPLVTDTLKAGKGDPGKIRAVWDFALGKADAKEFPAALAALKPLAQLLAQAANAPKTEAEAQSGKTTTERLAGNDLLEELKARFPAYKDAFATLKDRASEGQDLVKAIPDLVRDRKMDEARVALSKLDQMVKEAEDLKRRQAEAKQKVDAVFKDYLQRGQAAMKAVATAHAASATARQTLTAAVDTVAKPAQASDFITSAQGIDAWRQALEAFEAIRVQYDKDLKRFEDEKKGIQTLMSDAGKITAVTPEIGQLVQAYAAALTKMTDLAKVADWPAATEALFKLAVAGDELTRAKTRYDEAQAAAKLRVDPVMKDLIQRYNVGVKDLPAAPGAAEIRKAVVDTAGALTTHTKKNDWLTGEPLLPAFKSAVEAAEARKAEYFKDKERHELEEGGLADDLAAMLKIGSVTPDIGKLRKTLLKQKADIEGLVKAFDYKAATDLLIRMGMTISQLGKAKEQYDEARIAWMTEIGNARQAIAAVEGSGAISGPIDKIRADFLVQITDARTKAKANDYPGARKALAEALKLAADFQRDKGVLDDTAEKGFATAREKAAKTVPDLRPGAAEDGGATLRKVEEAMAENADLGKSKGLTDILQRSKIVDALHAQVTHGTSAEALQHVIDNAEAVLPMVTTYQKDHKANGSKGDREKFAQSEAIALHHRLQIDQLKALKPIFAKFEAIDCKALAKTPDAAVETLGWLDGVKGSGAPAGFVAAAKAKHGELLGALMAAAPNRDVVRQAAAMGGPEFKASFERQDKLGPLSATLKGKGPSPKERHAKTGLQNVADVENVEQSRALATRLIADDGSFELAALYAFDPDEIAGDSPASQQMAHALKLLRDDPKAQDVLQNIPAPEPRSQAADMIRATLGLADDVVPSAADARRAALSALTAELRQGQVGSCFGTQVAIRAHDTQPETFFKDISSLIKDGAIKRNVDGKEVTVNLQSKIDTTAATEPNIKLSRGANPDLVAGSSGPLAVPAKLEEAPGFQRTMDALGIDAKDRATMMRDALAEMQASAAFRKNQNEKALRAAVQKIDDDDERAMVLKRALPLLTDDPASVKQALEDAMADPDPDDPSVDPIDPVEQADAKNGFDAILNDPEFVIEPDKVMEALVRKKLGLSEADVNRAMAAEKLRGEIMTDPDVRSGRPLALPGDKAILDKMTLLEKEDKAIDWTKIRQMEGLLETSIKGFVGESQNPLLRAYEYTVTAMAEKNTVEKTMDEANDVIDEMVGDEIEDMVQTMVAEKDFKKSKVKEAKLSEIGAKLAERYGKVYRAGTSVGYDPTVGTELSEDGSSDRGAWRLFDTQGISNPDKWIAITDAKQYRRLVQGMMMLAWSEEFAKEKDENILKISRKLADQMADRLASEDFTKQARGKVKEETGEDLAEPWLLDGGGQSFKVLQVFDEKDAEVEEFGQPTDAEDLLKMTGDYLKTMLGDPKSGLAEAMGKHGTRATVNTRAVGSHAFSLVPGEPKLKALLEDPRSFEEALDDQVVKEKAEWDQGQKGTMLRGEEDVRDQLAMVRGYNGLANAAAAIWNTIKADATMEKFNKALEAHLKSAYGDTQDETDATLGKFLVGNFVPPVPAAELEDQLRKLAPKVGVPDDLVELVVKTAKADLDKLDPAKAGLPDIKSALKAAMEAEGIDAKGATAEAVRDALRKPKGIVLCDSNWGDGEHRIKFSMVVDPMTGELQMWQMNEDGSDARPAEKWLQREWHAMA